MEQDPKRQFEMVKGKIVQIVKKDHNLAITYTSTDKSLHITKTFYIKDLMFSMKVQDYIYPPWDHELGINPKKPF